ncbi:MAG TPA: NHL domain-containing thioredoxin family protein [Beutenbergiaceae bacterium]|nr:NHL domain-containing thioredoxin family protein [Beutenbergiaceae bacterium]
MTSSTERLPKVRASELRGRQWLNTGGTDLSLQGLRGKILLLDFWTFCCINCLHVIDELRPVEERFADVLVTVGVHSPKFAHEADPDALAAAVQRYEVAHPVLDDPELHTWHAYTARAWPTLVLIDPEGYIVTHMAGEGHAPNLTALIEELITEHEAKGTLHRGQGPYVPPEPAAGLLSFPAKAIALPSGNLLVADAGHHRLVEVAPDGETAVRTIGSGQRGQVDGPAQTARFSEPNGLCLLPEQVARKAGYDVVVADTAAHLLRGVDLDSGTVTTVAGTGAQFMVGAPDNVLPAPANAEKDPAGPDRADTHQTGTHQAGAHQASTDHTGTHQAGPDPADHRPATEDYGPARRIKLSSPWDVTWSDHAGAVIIAMAGHHTIWTFDPVDGHLSRLGGTMNEGLVDGELRQAWFAQPSGLTTDATGRIWLADSETSALRYLDLAAGQVRTAVGQGLFDFGHRDGPAGQALLQHPLGVAALADGRIAIADTYNGAVRLYDPATGQVSTAATGLAEPAGLLVTGGQDLIVAESAAHRLTRVTVGEASRHDGPAHRTQREVTEIAPDVTVRVVFTPAPGRKLDDRFGPSTQLEVGAAPEQVLISGGGTGTELARRLTLSLGTVSGPDDGETARPDDGEAAGLDDGSDEPAQTVLSVTAKAASCADDPDVEFPACHLTNQDWGIPVRVVQGGPSELVLHLAG